MATHSSTLAWKVLWTEKPVRLQSMGSQRVGHDWATSLFFFLSISWTMLWITRSSWLDGEHQGNGLCLLLFLYPSRSGPKYDLCTNVCDAPHACWPTELWQHCHGSRVTKSDGRLLDFILPFFYLAVLGLCYGKQASLVSARGFSSWGAWALERRLSNYNVQA